MAKFQFSGGGGGYSVIENTQSPKIWLNFNFRGGGYSVIENTQSPKIWLNFNFRGGGGILYYRIGVFCRICTKFSTTPAGSCITDSLSNTTYVETNERKNPCMKIRSIWILLTVDNRFPAAADSCNILCGLRNEFKRNELVWA